MGCREGVGDMKPGARIKWIFKHWTGSAFTWRVKKGEYIGTVKHTKRYSGPCLAVVKFDGNKGVSRVPLIEIEIIHDNGQEQDTGVTNG